LPVLTCNDADYPRLLLEIPDPPPFLYVRGNLESSRQAVAVVGSRNGTSYGKAIARRLGADLAACRLTVVSGMAIGIDTCAHQGALQAGGQTIAVMGTGLNQIYPARNRNLHDAIAESGAVVSELPLNAGPDARHFPARNRNLHDAIAESGAVVSELPLNAGPDARHFPARNRIISGMALGTLVVEATLKSGSLITARLAAEQNREVFAVPGSIDSFKSTGTHALIKQGAKLVENVQDILEELPAGGYQRVTAETPGQLATVPPPGELSTVDRKILAELDRYPVHIDELVRNLDLEPGELAAALLQLELKGVVHQDRGSRFSRKTR